MGVRLVTKFSTTKGRAIMAALKDIKGLPASVRKLLSMLRGKKFNTNGHEEAVCILQKILRAKDKSLQQEVCDLQDEVDGAEQEKNTRSDAQSAAESRVAEVKQMIAQAKLAMDTASKNIEVAQKALAEGKIGRKREAAELQSITRKKDRLESTKETAFVPLKDNMAKGIKGQKQVKVLRKVGKEFGFHDVLL